MRKEKQLEIINSKCSSCGGNVVYDANSQCLKCNSCNNLTAFTHTKSCLEHSIDEKTEDYKNYVEWQKDTKVMSCNNCGAKVILNTLEYSTVCPYCESSLVATKEMLPSLIPDGIIPFMFNEEIAQKHFIEKVKNRFWVNSKFKKSNSKKTVHGLYFPAFSFNADSKSSYNGKLSKTETKRTSNGETISVTKTFHISGNKKINHQNITEEVSSKVNQTELAYVQPYDYTKVRKFDEKFIMGYSVEHFDVGVSGAYARAKNKMNSDIRRLILARYSYDSVVYLNINTQFSNERYKYVLLPIYKFEYKFKKQSFVSYMNGQNGKIGGSFPLSVFKITLFSIIGVLILLLFIILFIYIGVS